MAEKAMDSKTRFNSMCAEVEISESTQECPQARSYETASDLAFSVPDPDSLELLTNGVLRDDETTSEPGQQTASLTR